MKINKLKHKYLIILLSLVLIISLTFLFIKWNNHTSTVVIHYVDQNGTSVSYDKVKTSKTGLLLKLKPFNKNVPGYSKVAQQQSYLIFPFKYREYNFAYRPMHINKQIKQLHKSKYIASTFQPMSVAPKNGKQSDPFNLARNYEGQSGRDSLRIIYSQDGLKWKQLKTNYPKINVRDPSITKIGNYWYVIFTHGLVRTKDFKHWKTLNWQYTKKFKNEWAPEFFKDKTGKYHIISEN